MPGHLVSEQLTIKGRFSLLECKRRSCGVQNAIDVDPSRGRAHRQFNVKAVFGLLERFVARSTNLEFIPSNSPQPLIFLAGGIGITPFINALETLDDGNPLEATLYYGNLNSSSHAFKARIDEHRGRLPNFEVVNHYDRPLPADRLGVDYDSSSPLSRLIW